MTRRGSFFFGHEPIDLISVGRRTSPDDLIDQKQWSTFALLVEAANVFAQDAEHEHLDAAQHSHHSYNAGPSDDSFSFKIRYEGIDDHSEGEQRAQ
jgi:hypothetical protein